jgi:hypothetical protein
LKRAALEAADTASAGGAGAELAEAISELRPHLASKFAQP